MLIYAYVKSSPVVLAPSAVHNALMDDFGILFLCVIPLSGPIPLSPDEEAPVTGHGLVCTLKYKD